MRLNFCRVVYSEVHKSSHIFVQRAGFLMLRAGFDHEKFGKDNEENTFVYAGGGYSMFINRHLHEWAK